MIVVTLALGCGPVIDEDVADGGTLEDEVVTGTSGDPNAHCHPLIPATCPEEGEMCTYRTEDEVVIWECVGEGSADLGEACVVASDCRRELACAGSRDVYGCGGDAQQPCTSDDACDPGEACILARIESVCVRYCFEDAAECAGDEVCRSLGIATEAGLVEDGFHACLPG